MNKKIGFIVLLIVFAITLLNVPLILAQEKLWDRAIVSAYGELLAESEPPLGSFTFRIETPPTGSEVTNTIILMALEDKSLCYVIKGHSYPAQQKLSKFIYQLKMSTEIKNLLRKAQNKGELISDSKAPELKNLIQQIFKKNDTNDLKK